MKPYRIPGSRLWRVWCEGCDTPMRSNTDAVDDEHFCEECRPHQPPARITGMVPRQAEKYRQMNPG